MAHGDLLRTITPQTTNAEVGIISDSIAPMGTTDLLIGGSQGITPYVYAFNRSGVYTSGRRTSIGQANAPIQSNGTSRVYFFFAGLRRVISVYSYNSTTKTLTSVSQVVHSFLNKGFFYNNRIYAFERRTVNGQAQLWANAYSSPDTLVPVRQSASDIHFAGYDGSNYQEPQSATATSDGFVYIMVRSGLNFPVRVSRISGSRATTFDFGATSTRFYSDMGAINNELFGIYSDSGTKKVDVFDVTVPPSTAPNAYDGATRFKIYDGDKEVHLYDGATRI